MTRPRREAITSHRDFPVSYADLVRRFATTKRLTITGLDHANALSTRNQMYRYIRWLSRAPPDDVEALSLYEIAQTMKCRIVPAFTDYTLEWFENPISAWARTNGTLQPYHRGGNK